MTTRSTALRNGAMRFLLVLLGGTIGAVLFAAWDHFVWDSGSEFLLVIYQAITGRALEPGQYPWVAWIAHAAVGTFLAAVFIYGQVYRFLPGPMWLRGMLYAGIFWIICAVAGLPLVPLFLQISGAEVGPSSMADMLAMVSLNTFIDVFIANMIYGAAMGAIAGFGLQDERGSLRADVPMS